MKTILLTCAALLSAALVAPAYAIDMEVEVSGLTQTEGRVMVGVFSDAGTWLKKSVGGASVEANQQKDGRVLVKLQDLPEGSSVGLSVFHDVNGNGKLDSNAMGMPKEPYGFSNNAAGVFGPPKFEKAQFEVKAGARIGVQLN